jgi:amidohydrolase
MGLIDDAETMEGELIELRHALHRAPEIGLHLPHTQARVLDALEGLPIELKAGDRLSSVVGVLRGGGPGPTVLLRGDMDALPVLEASDVAFTSQTDGTMHACGHDMHTAMLIGAAHLLSARSASLGGSVVFMFQPGEEGFDGAGKMLDEGVLEASGSVPVAAYALHVRANEVTHGTFASRPGPIMAAGDHFSVTVRGRGGHGSAPHRAKDPIPAACEMVSSLPTFLLHNVSAFDPAVITVGQIHAGNTFNIIPGTAWFEGSVRTFSPQAKEAIAAGMTRVCEGIAAAHGLEVEVEYASQFPLTINSADEAAFVANTVADVFGPEYFHEMPHPIGISEDFSRVIAAVPGALTLLGAAKPGADVMNLADNHSANAVFDDGVLIRGATLYAELATRRLAGLTNAGPAGCGD